MIAQGSCAPCAPLACWLARTAITIVAAPHPVQSEVQVIFDLTMPGSHPRHWRLSLPSSSAKTLRQRVHERQQVRRTCRATQARLWRKPRRSHSWQGNLPSPTTSTSWLVGCTFAGNDVSCQPAYSTLHDVHTTFQWLDAKLSRLVYMGLRRRRLRGGQAADPCSSRRPSAGAGTQCTHGTLQCVIPVLVAANVKQISGVAKHAVYERCCSCWCYAAHAVGCPRSHSSC